MTSTKGYRHGSKTRRDLYAEITDRIVDQLEQGVAPWVRPWRALGTAGEFRNGATGHVYSGINVMLLGMEMHSRGFADPRFVTFKQARAAGGHVRKGERGSVVVFYKPFLVKDRDDPSGERVKAIPFLRHFTVFNVDQCDGLTLPGDRTVDELPEPIRDAHCEEFMRSTGADIRHGGSQAVYKRRPLDFVQLPDPRAFKDIGAYYSTAFHELVHWTGDEYRCPRTKGKRFGDEDYAREELVAELGSAFLCQRLSVDGALQHPEYLANWLTVLRNDTRAIFRASGAASKAVEYLAERDHQPSAIERVAA